MYKGDISNEIPKRLIVTYEALTQQSEIPRKVLGIPAGTTTRRQFDRLVLNQLWRYSNRFAMNIEMVKFGVGEDEAEKRLNALDTFGTSAVNYSSVYHDLAELISDLPYRPEVVGVVDIPENQARYGLIGVGLDHLNRMF